MSIQDMEWLIQTVETQKNEINSLKTKSWFPVFEENLKFAEENEKLKKQLAGVISELETFKAAYYSSRFAASSK